MGGVVSAAILAALLLAPVACAKPTEAPYTRDADALLEAAETRLHAAESSMRALAMGELTTREAARALKSQAGHVDVLRVEAGGIEPPHRLQRGHGSLVATLDSLALGLRETAACYRAPTETGCIRARETLDRAAIYASAAASRLGSSAFS